MASASGSSSECTLVVAVGDDTLAASRLRPRQASAERRATGRRPRPVSAYLCWSSLFEPPRASQLASGPKGVARSEPCPTFPAELPPRYAPEAARPLCGPAANRRPTTPRLRARRLLSQPSFAFPLQDGSSCSLASEHLLDVCSLSGRAQHPYPTRYKPAFASSSILSRSANRSPCGSPARAAGRLVGVSTFRFISSRGGRCLLSAGEHDDREGLPFWALSDSLTFWSKPISSFGLFSLDGRSTQVHVSSPCPLSSPHPVLSYQEGPTLSRFRTPRASHASAHCQGRSLFRPLDSPGDTGGPLFMEDTYMKRLRVAQRPCR